jgi:xylulokinase
MFLTVRLLDRQLQGERSPFTDPGARAGFLNLSANTTSAHMARAVLEGVALNYRALTECLSLPRGEPIPVVGGGANSELWMQTLADCLQTPVLPQPDADAVAARGCSAEAMLWIGAWPDGIPPPAFFETAKRGVVKPDPDLAALYDERYTVFREIYPALKATSLYAP